MFTTPYKTPRVGLEPTSENQQAIENKELTEKQNPVLSTSLDKIVQQHPEIEQIITAWPELPEHIRQAIKTLVLIKEKTLNRRTEG